MNRALCLQSSINQVLDDFTLAVDPDGPAAGKIAQGNPMTTAIEAQLNAMVHQPFTPEPVAKSRVTQ
jgi:hypothetical protein